jgi:hypothetical protein
MFVVSKYSLRTHEGRHSEYYAACSLVQLSKGFHELLRQRNLHAEQGTSKDHGVYDRAVWERDSMKILLLSVILMDHAQIKLYLLLK